MPLFMDFHHIPGITVEMVKQAHMADLQVQDQLGVRYLQFWVNEEMGHVFCLIDGPDALSCEKVHQMAHGGIACNLQRVEQGMFNLFMGKGSINENHLTLTNTGSIDIAKRTIMVVDIKGRNHQAPGLATALQDYKKDCLGLLNEWNGRHFEQHLDGIHIGIFNASGDALNCALQMRENFSRSKKLSRGPMPDLEFRMALNHDQPLKEVGGFFEDALKTIKHYLFLVRPGEILLSSNLERVHGELVQKGRKIQGVHILSSNDEVFVDKLFAAIDSNIDKENFGIEQLAKEVAMSRAQLFRRIKSLSGRSPNKFVNRYRMHLALELLKMKKYNVCQVAQDLGYSNPSYFSKMFKKEFGILPSELSH